MRFEDIPANYLQTDRIYLEPPSLDRLQEIQAIINNFGPLHYRFVNKEHRSKDIAKTREYLEFAIKHFADKTKRYAFYIAEQHTHNIVGYIAIMPENPDIGYFKIGYWTASKALGKGYATEACRLVRNIALRVLSAHRLEMQIAKSNVASQIVAERAGFKRETDLRAAVVGLNGNPDIAHVYVYPFQSVDYIKR